jgi:hypothetical protein
MLLSANWDGAILFQDKGNWTASPQSLPQLPAQKKQSCYPIPLPQFIHQAQATIGLRPLLRASHFALKRFPS